MEKARPRTAGRSASNRYLSLGRRFVPRTPDGVPQEPAILNALRGEEVSPHERVMTDARGLDHRLIVSAAPVRGDGISGAVVVFVDVAESRRMEEELRRAVDFRERVMGIVSHDLRTPLGAISMTAESVLARPSAPPWARSSALRVKRSVDRMSRMVSDLLDFTRIAAMGGLPLERRPMDLRGPVQDAVDEIDISHPGRVRLALPDHAVDGTWREGRGDFEPGTRHDVRDTFFETALIREQTPIHLEIKGLHPHAARATSHAQAPIAPPLRLREGGPPELLKASVAGPGAGLVGDIESTSSRRLSDAGVARGP